MKFIRTHLSWAWLLVFVIIAVACDSEDGLNCTQASGNFIEQEFQVESFDKILVFERLKLTVKDGPIQKVVVKTGENLLNDIDVIVNDGRLEIVNNNGCNLFRDYGITEVVVTSPNITEIRSSTGEDVRSEGVLGWDNLTLLSNDGPEEDFYHSTGNFRLHLDVQNLIINTNKLSNFYLSGTVENADFNWDEGDGRLIANDLIIQNAQIFHRGTASWNMDVRENISGIINGYGDVILKSQPATVDVQETWQGRLIIDQ